MKLHWIRSLSAIMAALLLCACGTLPQTETAQYTAAGANITLTIPADWSWETTAQTETTYPGLRIWPEADPEAAVSVTLGIAPGCGMVTSRSDVTYDNGYTARMTYDDYGDTASTVITYTNVPGSYYVAYTYTDAQAEAYSTVIDAILNSAVLADGIIREETALTLAQPYKTEEDQLLRAKYDMENAVWEVGIYPAIGGPTPLFTVTISSDGTVAAAETPAAETNA